jgi:hypothetical protein
MFKKEYLALLILWSLSLATSFTINLYYFPSTLSFPDEFRFLSSALRLHNEGIFVSNSGRAWEMPLTAVYIAAIKFIFSLNDQSIILAVRFSQSILIIVQSYCAWLIAGYIFKNKQISLLSAGIICIYPFFLFYQGLLLSETLFNTLLLCGITSAYAWQLSGTSINWRFFLALTFFGLATYTKGSLTLLPPIILLSMLFIKKVTLKDFFKIFVLSFSFYFLILSPWWIRNYLIFQEFIPLTTSSSFNLYLGNNSNNFLGGNSGDDADPQFISMVNALPNELDKSRIYKEVAYAFIKDNPERFINLSTLKFFRFWNVIPNAESYNTGYFKYVSIISFGPVLFFSLLGILINRSFFKNLIPIYILIIYFTLLHTITIASLRYRLPIEPFLILLSSAAFINIFNNPYIKRICKLRY